MVTVRNVTTGTSEGESLGDTPPQRRRRGGHDRCRQIEEGTKVRVEFPGGTDTAARQRQACEPVQHIHHRPVATSSLWWGFCSPAWWPINSSVSALPEVDYPTIQVIILSGASPDVMASSVTARWSASSNPVPTAADDLHQLPTAPAPRCNQAHLNIDVAEQEVQQSINASGPTSRRTPLTPPTARPIPPTRRFLPWRSPPTPCRSQSGRISRIPASRPRSRSFRASACDHQRRPEARRPHQANLTLLASCGLNLEDVRAPSPPPTVIRLWACLDGRFQLLPDRRQRPPAPSADDYSSVILAYRNGAPVKLTDAAIVRTTRRTPPGGVAQ